MQIFICLINWLSGVYMIILIITYPFIQICKKQPSWGVHYTSLMYI